MAAEINYLVPHVVFVDGALLVPEAHLCQSLSKVQRKCIFVFVGPFPQYNRDQLESELLGHLLIFHDRLDFDIKEDLFSQAQTYFKRDSKLMDVFLNSDDFSSFGFIFSKLKLTSMHPKMMYFETANDLNPFSLFGVRIAVPGKAQERFSGWFKLFRCRKVGEKFELRAIWINCEKHNRQLMSEGILKEMNKELAGYMTVSGVVSSDTLDSEDITQLDGSEDENDEGVEDVFPALKGKIVQGFVDFIEYFHSTVLFYLKFLLAFILVCVLGYYSIPYLADKFREDGGMFSDGIKKYTGEFEAPK